VLKPLDMMARLAALAGLLDEPTAPAVRRLLGEAEVIVASNSTLTRWADQWRTCGKSR